MFDEEELLPVSAVQHLIFCERRAALIHIEGLWEENEYTAGGRILHEAAHEPGSEQRGDIRIVRGLPISSRPLGLTGKADVVELHRVRHGHKGEGSSMPGLPGRWRVVPVEYKRGRLRLEQAYRVQLCAQALCLEEALGARVEEGTIFYGQSRRRLRVVFTERLRRETASACQRLHELISSGHTPRVRRSAKCRRCSMQDVCLPGVTGSRSNIGGYLKRMVRLAASAEGSET